MTASQDVTSYFNEIYDSTSKGVLAFITAKCGNPEDIGDIFQETYMDLYKMVQKNGVASVANSGGLVFKIAKRKLARYYDRKARRPVVISSTADDDNGDEVDLLELEADLFMTEEIAVNAAIIEDAGKFLKSKSHDVQKAFYLFYYFGVSIPEIAKQLGISESNVKHKIYRTLSELKDRYK